MILWSAWDCIHLGGPAAHALHGGFREHSERSWGATLGVATGGTAPVANVTGGYIAESTQAARTQPRGRVRAPPKVPEICPQKTEFDLQNAAVRAFLTPCGQTQLVNACSERRPTGPGAAAGLRPAVSAPGTWRSGCAPSARLKRRRYDRRARISAGMGDGRQLEIWGCCSGRDGG